MEFILKRMNIWNFKGIKEKTVDFDETFTRITGKNGCGKTTIATSFYWVFCGEDYDLKSNPMVHPIGKTELTPTVEVIFEIDGKPMRITKSQSMKITEVGNTRKTATVNTYAYNDVEISERDLQKRLEEFGLDFSKIEILTHPDSFLLGKKDEIRKTLFGMASTFTDKEIADGIGSQVSETAELLVNYRIEEIQAMQKSTLRKIEEAYGKKGEILSARIEGLENAKVEYDFSALELLKNSLTEKLSENEKKRKINLGTQRNIDILQEKNMNLQFELSRLKNSLSATKQEKLSKMEKEIEALKADLNTKAKKYKDLQAEELGTKNKLAYAQRELAVAKDFLSKAEAMAFDTNTEICPTCKQKLPDSDIAKLHENFERTKKSMIDKHTGDISEAENLINGYQETMDALANQLKICATEGKAVQDEYTELVSKYKTYYALPAEEADSEMKPKEDELAEVNRKIEELRAAYIPNLDLEEVDLRAQLTDTEVKLGQADTNCQIDEKIAALREKQVEYEQNRANAEKILFQLDLIQKRKNELLTDEINKHFGLVKWKLFDQLKNGTFVDVAIPTVDGKDLNTALNTAMQIRAKIDICNSLQNFYNQHLPIWLDGAEALDYENQEALLTDTQMVLLSVKD